MQWNLAELFEGIADRLADEVVLVGPDRESTWSALDRRADAFAADLLASGLRRGSRVGLCAGNVPAYLEAVVGCVKVGAVPFNMNYRYRAGELAYLLDNADAEAVVGDAGAAPDLAEALAGRGLRTYAVGREPLPGSDRFDDVAAGSWSGRTVPPWGRSANDRMFLYTGGTTGHPKAVVWRHGDLVELIAGTATPPGGEALTAADDILGRLARPPVRSLTAAPMIHATGLLSQLANMMSGGCSVFTGVDGFDPGATWRAVARHGVNVLVLVGDVFAVPLLRELEAGGHDASALRMISSSGAMWSRPVKERLLELLPGVALLDGFGSTEAANLGRSMSSAGAIDATASFVMGDRARVLADDGTWVAPGSGIPGRVAIHGPLPVEYHKDPERTAATFTVREGVRWSIPGDYVLVGADGTLTLLGRGSSCINTGGEKVYPEEVEEVLKEHPDVFDACCVGVPDERFGETVCAIVQPEGNPPDPDELVAFVKERLASYKGPRQVVVVETLGRLPNGKLDRVALQAVARSARSDQYRYEPGVSPAPGAHITVLIVDDEPDLRALITVVLELDGRYQVVGEAGDGAEGVELASALQPDVVVLDRSMPTMTGLEALPHIQHVAPNAAVIIYTAENDQQVQQAAMASGAVGVLTKDGSIGRLAGVLSDALLRSSPDAGADLGVRVGPVPSDVALDWIDSSAKIIDAVGAAPSLADVEIAPDIIETFRRYLDSWREIAEASPEFVWAARASAADVEQLLEAWITIDAIDTHRLTALGLAWSSPRGRLFKNALTDAVLEVLQRKEALQTLTRRLQRQWDR